MVLTRVLAPELFGLMALVVGFSSILESLTEAGVRYAIIQNPRGGERAYLTVAFWFSCARGLLLYLAAFMCAPLVSRFYGNHEITLLVRITCLSIVLNGCLNVALFARMKSMDFKSWALACNGGSILSVTATVLLAFLVPSVWVIVFGIVSDAAIRCILSYLVCPFAPGLKLGKEEFRALLRYSRGFAGLPILFALSRNVDIFVLAKVIPSSSMGIYSLCSSLVRAPQSFLNGLVAQVALPALSAVQEDEHKSRKAIVQGTSLLACIALPALAFVCVYATSILGVIYGTRYAAAGIPFAFLFTAAAAETITLPITTLYFSAGRPELERLFLMVRAGVLIVLIVPGSLFFGWNGAAFSVLVATIIACGVQTARLRSISNIGVGDFLKALRTALFPTALALSICLIGETAFGQTGLIIRAFFAAGGLVFAYGVTAYSVVSFKGRKYRCKVDQMWKHRPFRSWSS